MLSLTQLRLRQTGITATDIVKLSGENPWGSAIQVYEDKMESDQALIERSRLPPSDRELNGHVFEKALADRYLMDLSVKASVYESTLTYRAPDCDWALATPDRFVFEGSGEQASARIEAGEPADWILECKLVGSRVSRGWDLDEGASDADRIPSYVYTQVQWQMRVLGYARCDVAALLYGTTFRSFRVARDDEYIASLNTIAQAFWRDHVMAGRPPEPDGSEAYSRYLDRRHPEVRRPKLLEPPCGSQALVLRYDELRAAEKEARVQKEKIGQVLRTMVADSDGFGAAWGSVMCPMRAGNVDHEALLKHLGTPKDVVEKFRQPPTRSLAVRVAKAREERL